MSTHLLTPRLLLRPLLVTDAEGLFALDSDPEVHRYLGNKPVTSIATCYDVIHNVQQQYEDNGIGRWAIIDRETQDFIGWAGLKYEQGRMPGVAHYYDLGYRLRRPYWGQGIATEAATLWLQYGFEQLQLPEIGAIAHVENIGSNTILRKIGLRFMDTFQYDEETPCNWYALERTDWEAREK